MNAPAQTRTADILNAIGIKKLYWIDDNFYETGGEDRNALVIAASNAIADAIEIGTSINSIIPALADITHAGLARDANVTFASQFFEDNNFINDQLIDILKQLDAYGTDEPEEETTTFEDLLQSDHVELIKLSFGKWQADKENLVSTQEALYLIDYENKREGNGINGDTILEYLAGLEISPFSIVFTHICDPNSEHESAIHFHTKLNNGNNLRYRQFSVMSKKRFSGKELLAELDTAFAPPLKRLAIGHTYRQVATTCLKGYENGVKEALNKLDLMPVTDIYQTIFERSWEEGASEIDVVSRILNAAQRKAMFDEIVSSTTQTGRNFFPALTSLRNVSDIAIASDTAAIDPYIGELHNVEIFDSDIINKMHLPLSCGDIFQKTPSGPKYILLAPPCDLMIRTDSADRNAVEGIFVPLKELSSGTQGGSDVTTGTNDANRLGHKKWEITKKDGNIIYADFHEPFTVNLLVLDYCVWNGNGEVKFNRRSPPRESRIFLEGWLKRLRDVKQKCSASFPTEYRALCFVRGPNEFKEKPDPNNGAISFPLKRIGRLRSPYAEAVLNEYLASLGRPAFDHPLIG